MGRYIIYQQIKLFGGIKMMRDGKPLGMLNWKTDKIQIMQPSKLKLSLKDLREMETGKFVIKARG